MTGAGRKNPNFQGVFDRWGGNQLFSLRRRKKRQFQVKSSASVIIDEEEEETSRVSGLESVLIARSRYDDTKKMEKVSPFEEFMLCISVCLLRGILI